MSSSNSTFQSFSSSSSSTIINGQITFTSEQTHSDPSGTRTLRTSQTAGEAPRVERFETDHASRRLEDVSVADAKRVQDVTEQEDTQAKMDRQYEEKMEDEYAKREGGA
ncbi:hypothetical protein EJ02DRAFT_466992 [Clathrospora elynae]|uniref:Uncharacterized protein n=1 Tax=Clathrospora elynae TaxID=706981 RepID=A0A6A5SME8_9PLEO|nr:hypothetical protein EJ02DRAFT_466992 [Clathrospora elynae]